MHSIWPRPKFCGLVKSYVPVLQSMAPIYYCKIFNSVHTTRIFLFLKLLVIIKESFKKLTVLAESVSYSWRFEKYSK